MFRVSCIQLKSNNNILHNLNKTKQLISKAVKQKSDFILTPEISSLFSLEKKKLLKICKSMKEDIYLNGISISRIQNSTSKAYIASNKLSIWRRISQRSIRRYYNCATITITCTVCKSIFLFSRLWYTEDIMGISSSCIASPWIIEANVAISLIDNEACPLSGFIYFL
mgnify:CR=1 FL=1